MVGGFHGMLLLSAKHSRSLVWWADTLWEAVRKYHFTAQSSRLELVEYHPISAKDLSRLHRFDPKVLPGIFLGYALHAAGIWKGDMMVADIEEMEEMYASELHARRLNAMEVFTPLRSEKFIFPIADGTVKLSGGGQVLRTSTLIRDSPDRGEEQDNLQGESDGSSSTPRQDSSLHDGEARNDFWSMSANFVYRHHVEPRVKLYVTRKESFPIPLKYIDVTGATNTSLDVTLQKTSTIFGTLLEIENCQIRGQVSQVSPYSKKNHKMDFHGPGRDWKENKRTSRLDRVWPEMWKHMSDASKRKEKQKWSIEKPKLDNARKSRGFFCSLILMMRNSRISWKMRVESWKFRCLPQCLANFNVTSTGNLSRWKEVQDKRHLHCRGRWIYKEAHGRISSQESWWPFCRKRNEFSESLQSCVLIYSYASRYQNTRCQSSSGEIMRKTRENTGMAADESQEQKWRDRWSKEWRPYCSFCVVNGSLSSQEFGVGTTVSKIQRSNRTPRWRCERWFKIIRSIYRTKIISFTNGGCKSDGRDIKALPRCAGQAADAISAYTQVRMEDAPSLFEKSQSQNVQILGYVYQNTNGPWLVQYGRSSLSSWTKSVRWSYRKTFMGKANLREFFWKTYGKKFQIVNAYSLTERKVYSCLLMKNLTVCHIMPWIVFFCRSRSARQCLWWMRTETTHDQKERKRLCSYVHCHCRQQMWILTILLSRGLHL